MNTARAMMLFALAGLSISSAQAAEPEILTLACEGTATDTTQPDAKRDLGSYSMSIVLNFTTLKADVSVVSGMQMDLLRVTETTIIFSGSDLGKTFGGVIDRVTGETKAGLTILNTRTTPNKVALDHDYALKCRPAQRMF